jgi:hypothetical protein
VVAVRVAHLETQRTSSGTRAAARARLDGPPVQGAFVDGSQDPGRARWWAGTTWRSPIQPGHQAAAAARPFKPFLYAAAIDAGKYAGDAGGRLPEVIVDP